MIRVGFAHKSRLKAPFLGNRRFCPESRSDAELVNRLNENTEIVADDLAENLVHLSDWRLGSNGRAKLRLNHREGALDVRTLVIALQELAPIELVKVEHLAPQFRTFTGRVALERNVRNRPGVHNHLQVSLTD